jgi:hypothetical protein
VRFLLAFVGERGTPPRGIGWSTPAPDAGIPPDSRRRCSSALRLVRTVASRLVEDVGCDAFVVEHVILGHVRPKLMRTYMPSLKGKPLQAARAALSTWADMLDGILIAAPASEQE